MGTIARLDMIMRADTNQARNQFRTLRTEVALLQGSIHNVSVLGSNMLNSLTTIAKWSVMAFGAVSVASVASIAVVKEYDKNLTHAAAIANLTKGEMEELGRQINLMSLQFGQSANDISSGVVELTKAGLGMGDISAYMDDITKAMLANGISFEQAAQIAIFAAKQFGGEQGFGAIPELLDMIQKVTQETIMDFGDLQQALAYAGSTATLARVDFANLLSMMGALSQRAMEMGIASRSVNQMMMNLIDNADEMQKWVDQMGLGVQVIKDGALNITELITKFSELDFTMEMLQKSSDIFTVRAMRSWGLLITGADEYLKLLNEDIPNSVGVLDQVFERQTETIQFHLSQLGNIMTAPLRNPEYIGKIIEMLEKLEGPVMNLSKILYTGLFKFLTWTTEHADEIINFFGQILKFAFKLVEPFYNLGKWVTRLSDGMLKFVIYTKMLISLGLVKYMKFAWMIMQQQLSLKMKLIGLQGTELSTQMDLLNIDIAKHGIALTEFQIANMKVKTDADELRLIGLQLQLEKQKLDVQQMQVMMNDKLIAQKIVENAMARNTVMLYASMAASAAMTAFASYATAEAMGATTGDYARNILMGIGTGALMGSVAGPKGVVIGGFIGGISAGVGTYLGDKAHTPFEPTVDLNSLEGMFNNMNYSSTSYTPTELTQSTSVSESGGFGGGGTVVNIYADTVAGDQAIEGIVRRAIDGN